MQFTSVALAALLGVAQAVDVQVVAVGKNPQTNATAFKYWPENIVAAPGSLVQFQFWAGNHTVTQSDFDHPCRPIAAVNGSAGIKSGYMPVAASASEGEIPTFTIEIHDSKPMWLYCSQSPHCQMGMAMVINQNTTANASRSLENYKAAAALVPKNSTSGSQTVTASGTSGPSATPTGQVSGASSTVLSLGGPVLALIGSLFALL